jgi:hypothetical protein
LIQIILEHAILDELERQELDEEKEEEEEEERTTEIV